MNSKLIIWKLISRNIQSKFDWKHESGITLRVISGLKPYVVQKANRLKCC